MPIVDDNFDFASLVNGFDITGVFDYTNIGKLW
jgi:hypothetical protein